MFVKDWMRTKLITVNEDDTILDAVHLMKDNRIRRLPVLKKGKLTGIITEKDIKEFSPSKASTLDIYEMHNILAKSVVKDAMTRDVINVNPENPIERAALILRDKRFGGLPVVNDKGELCGIITSVDVFDVFVEAMGMRKAGARITIFVEDQPGAIAEIAKIIKQESLNIISLATFYFKDKPEGFRDIVIRVSGERDKIQTASNNLNENGFKITSLLFLDASNIVK